MARTKREITLGEMVAPIRRFRDTVRRLNQAIEQVELACSDGWARRDEDAEESGVPPLPWNLIWHREFGALLEAVQSVAAAADALAQDVARMQENEYRVFIQAAVDVARWVLSEVQTNGFKLTAFGIQWGKRFKSLQRADGWLSFVEDVAGLLAMPQWQREVLQVLDEQGPSLQKDLAREMQKAALPRHVRDGLPRMVQAGLLISSRGQCSEGYSLTPLGLRLAQLSRQLGDF